jgi:hypothetical protein
MILYGFLTIIFSFLSLGSDIYSLFLPFPEPGFGHDSLARNPVVNAILIPENGIIKIQLLRSF